MRKFYYLCLSLVLVLFACTKEVGMEDVQKDTIVNDVEALTDADRALYSLTTMLDDVAPQTRMTSGQTIKAQTLINVSDIIAEEYSNVAGYDNAFYLVTLENENGVASTAFLGATPNLPSVIAIINGVEYTIEDCCEACAEILGYEYISTDNTTTRLLPGTGTPGLIIPPIVPPITTIIGTPTVPWNPGTPSDPDPEVPLPDIPTDPGNFTTTSETHYRIITKVDPLMKSHFHQGSPYNNNYDYTNDTDSVRYYAGCTVIAVAQVMAYNKIELNEGPDAINGVAIDWDNIEKAIDYQDSVYKQGNLKIEDFDLDNYKDALASFCDLIADEIVLFYRKNGTSSNLKQAKDFLEQCEYQNLNKQAFDSDTVKNMIVNSKRPVLIGGQKVGLIKGHTWVIDGWYHREKVKITTLYQNGNPVSSTTNVLSTEKYLHYNWGWATCQDGYYAEGVYNTNNVYQPTYPGEHGSYEAEEYDKLVKILTYDSAQ